MTGLPLGHTHIYESDSGWWVRYYPPLVSWSTYRWDCRTEAEVKSAIRTARLYYEADHRPLPAGKYKPARRDQFGRRVGRNGEGA